MKLTKYFWGLLLIAAGALLILTNTKVLVLPDNFLKFWPALLIIFGLVTIYDDRSVRPSNVALIVIGAILLLRNYDIFKGINIWVLILALFLVYMGVNVIFPRQAMSRHRDGKDGKYESFNVLSGSQNNINADFNYGDFTAFLGGAEINLVNSNINPEGAIIYARVFMGGIDITLPAGTEVIVKGFILFGGVDQKHKTIAGPNGRKIIVDVSGAFGGVDIKLV